MFEEPKCEECLSPKLPSSTPTNSLKSSLVIEDCNLSKSVDSQELIGKEQGHMESGVKMYGVFSTPDCEMKTACDDFGENEKVITSLV